MGLFQKLKDRRKDKLQQRGKDQNQDGIKDGGIVERLLKRVEPYRKGMEMLLAQKGVRVSAGLGILPLMLLFAERVQGKNVSKIRQDLRISTVGNFEDSDGYVVGDLAATTVTLLTSIISGITTLFLKLKEQKDKGELNPAQEKAVEAAEKGVEAVQEGTGTANVGFGARKVPSKLQEAAPLIIIGAAILLGGKLKL